MILGRPTNLWLGLLTALSGAVTATLIAVGFPADTVGILVGVWFAVLGALILIVANQPPTVLPEDPVIIQTPYGKDNVGVTMPTLEDLAGASTPAPLGLRSPN